MGWGQKLQDVLPAGNKVDNRAVNGRSSRSFVEENRLREINQVIREGDVLVISFSHNDEKDDPARHTDPETTFPAFLRMYIETARRHGAEPILATPIPRRHYDAQGQLMLTHGPYPDAMRALAKAEGVKLVELEAAAMEMLQEMGPEGTKAIYNHLPAGTPNYPDGEADNSHLQENGAEVIARLFWDLLNGKKTAETHFHAAGDTRDLLAAEDEPVV